MYPVFSVRRGKAAPFLVACLVTGLMGLGLLWRLHLHPTLLEAPIRSGSPSTVGQHDPETWTPPVVPEVLRTADQDHERLIQHIREHWVLPPFPRGQWRLKSGHRTHYSQEGQSQAVDKLLDRQTGGFFVECGAGDGEFISNTLFFEKTRNWTGLLVEANPLTFKDLTGKRRHAYMVNACLSPTRHPMVMNYTLTKAYMGGISDFMLKSHMAVLRKKKWMTGATTVQCFPLASILKAIGVTRLDYFSLDIEGAELQVLRTLPFKHFDIGTVTVEFQVQGDQKLTNDRLASIKQLMIEENGYHNVSIIHNLDILLRK